MRLYATLLLVIASSPITSLHAEEHRQHGAHQHGSGQLNVALEQNTLEIELSLPAMNIVGFEHAPSNPEEQQKINVAVVSLKDGLNLLGPSKAANCSLQSVELHSILLGDEDDDDHHAHEDNADDDADHDDHTEEHHADFDIDYEFRCESPAQLNALSLTLFQQFPGTQQLTAQVATAKGQSGVTLSADHPQLPLQ